MKKNETNIFSGKIGEEGISVKEYYDYAIKKKYKHSIAIVKKLYKLGVSFDKGPILDVGTGVGTLVREISSIVTKRIPIIGIDIDIEMLRYAKEVTSKYAQHIFFIQNSPSLLPFKKESFQIIISEDSLHHWMNTENMLKELLEILKKDGVMILIDINKDSKWSKLLIVYFNILRFLNLISKPSLANYMSIKKSYNSSQMESLLQKLFNNTCNYTFFNFKSCYILKLEKRNV